MLDANVLLAGVVFPLDLEAVRHRTWDEMT
jgi:hypothetical protein